MTCVCAWLMSVVTGRRAGFTRNVTRRMRADASLLNSATRFSSDQLASSSRKPTVTLVTALVVRKLRGAMATGRGEEWTRRSVFEVSRTRPGSASSADPTTIIRASRATACSISVAGADLPATHTASAGIPGWWAKSDRASSALSLPSPAAHSSYSRSTPPASGVPHPCGTTDTATTGSGCERANWNASSIALRSSPRGP